MEKLYKAHPDKLKAIGIHKIPHLQMLPIVSNCSVPYLERPLKETTIVPAVNQIELHP